MGYLKRLFSRKHKSKEESNAEAPTRENPEMANVGEAAPRQPPEGEAGQQEQQSPYNQQTKEAAKQETAIEVIQREEPAAQRQQVTTEAVFTAENKPADAEAAGETGQVQTQAAVGMKQWKGADFAGTGAGKRRNKSKRRGKRRHIRAKNVMGKTGKKKRAKVAGKKKHGKTPLRRKRKFSRAAKGRRSMARAHAKTGKKTRARKSGEASRKKWARREKKIKVAANVSAHEAAGADLQQAAQPDIGGMQIQQAPLRGHEASAGAGHPNDRLSEFIEGKAGKGVDSSRLAELDQKVNKLMRKYNISEMEVGKRLDGVNAQDVFSSIDRLISIIELEKKASESMNRAERIQTAVPVSESVKHAEEVIGIATEIKKHRLVTAFDGIYSMINEKGHVKFGELASAFKMPSAKLEECCNVLREAGLIEIVYPAIGEPTAQALDYGERVALERLRKTPNMGVQGKKGG